MLVAVRLSQSHFFMAFAGGLLIGGAVYWLQEWRISLLVRELQDLEDRMRIVESTVSPGLLLGGKGIPPPPAPVIFGVSCTEAPRTAVYLDEAKLVLTIPCDYDLVRVPAGTGALASFTFRRLGIEPKAKLATLAIFTPETIRKTDESCDGVTCPNERSFTGERNAWTRRGFYGPKQPVDIGSVHFLARNDPCAQGSCRTRLYTTFLGDRKIDISLVIPGGVLDREADTVMQDLRLGER